MSGHLCYFSKRCRFCQAFLEELARTPFSKTVRLICVDPSPSRPPLPAWLKVVPTMILQDGNALVGPTAVNNWLFEQRLMNGTPAPKPDPFKDRTQPTGPSAPAYSPDLPPRATPAAKLPPAISANTAAKPTQGPPALAGDATEGPEAWHSAEMAGGNWSDAYSFLGDSFTAEKGVNPIHRNFELLHAPGPVGSKGGGGGGGAPVKRSAKEEKLLADFEAFSKARDMEFGGSKRIG